MTECIGYLEIYTCDPLSYKWAIPYLFINMSEKIRHNERVKLKAKHYRKKIWSLIKTTHVL